MENQDKNLPQVITDSFQEAETKWFQDLKDKFNNFYTNFKQSINWQDEFKFSTPSIVTITVTIFCLLIILVAIVSFFNTSYGSIVHFFSTWGIKFLKFSLPLLTKIFSLLLKLIVTAITTLWIPSIIYMGIYVLVKSQWLRLLLSLTVLSLIYLFILQTLQFNLAIFGTILDIYFFILLVTPRFVWLWISGSFVFIIGLILAMIPNFPIFGGTIDFGIFSALFVFLFFFIHNLASFIKLFAKILGDNFNLSTLKQTTKAKS